jgi:small subunit ribosomal protein S6
MKRYESLVILKAAGSEQEVARAATALEEPIKKIGGTVETAQGLGRRRLAFPISKQTEGVYHLIRFQAPTEQIVELGRVFRLNDAIVRFVILAAEEAGITTVTALRPPSSRGSYDGPRYGSPRASPARS